MYLKLVRYTWEWLKIVDRKHYFGLDHHCVFLPYDKKFTNINFYPTFNTTYKLEFLHVKLLADVEYASEFFPDGGGIGCKFRMLPFNVEGNLPGTGLPANNIKYNIHGGWVKKITLKIKEF